MVNPSSMAARRKARANLGLRSRLARSMFQSSLRRAMLGLQKVAPVLLSPTDVPGLGRLGPAEEQQQDLSLMRSEVETVPGTDGEPGLPDSIADRLVVAEVPRLEPRNARGDAGLCRNGEGAQPLAIRPAGVMYWCTVQDIASQMYHKWSECQPRWAG